MRELCWIWLPKEAYANEQATIYSGFADKTKGNYTVAEFKREYRFDKRIRSVRLNFSGDTFFELYINGEFVATGPPCVGGDFLENDAPRKHFYYYTTENEYTECGSLCFFARVRMMPVQICEYSMGKGGFALSANITFEDGSSSDVGTDEDWLVRKNGAFICPGAFDNSVLPDEFTRAEVVDDVWNACEAPVPVRSEREIFAEKGGTVRLGPHETKKTILSFDKIWSGFVAVKAKTRGSLKITVTCRELDEERPVSETLTFSSDGQYRGSTLQSAGNLAVELTNASEYPSEATVSYITTHYPVYEEANTVTDSDDVNAVLQTCKHTLKICRQTHHLDSPRHCEPLACTGDYYIESLMTPFSFGDMRLSEFDLIRTANMLEDYDGRMFHTSYSLIFVKMLYDVFMLTGNYELLKRCEGGLELLLKRFERYVGAGGLVENPPDYMFVDWIFIDGFSMHHPPKALGQTCLNAYYYEALKCAEKIYMRLEKSERAKECARKAKVLRVAVNNKLFDKEKRIYFDGSLTPEGEERLGEWLPENAKKRYYLKHSNILAAAFGLADDELAVELVDKIMSDEIEGEYQPYFAHYLFEAIYRLGLRDRYTVKLLERWIDPIKKCSKGLVEGFIAPDATYRFDHSHAWGGSPLYSLPKALSGLEILAPGMSELALDPSLLCFNKATVELFTPSGKLIVQMEKGKTPKITAPDNIKIRLRS